jgi:hypothetical protein
MSGLEFLKIAQHAGYAIGRNKAVDDAQLEKLAGELLGFFVGGHGRE